MKRWGPWVLLGLAVVGLMVSLARASRRQRALEAARAEAVAHAARTVGVIEASERQLDAARLEADELRQKIQALEEAGGEVSRRVKLQTGVGVVAFPSQSSPQTPRAGSGSSPPQTDTPAPDQPSSGYPPCTVAVGPASVECAEVSSGRRRWWACSDVTVRVTPPGEDLRLPLDPTASRWEIGVSPGDTPVLTLLGADAGLRARGYELGVRIYPRQWALAGRLAEARLGLYARAERGGGDGLAAGLSLMWGW